MGAPILSVTPHGNGHINDTYRVKTLCEDGAVKAYILQRMSSAAFKHPEQLMENIVGVTEYLVEKIRAAGGDVDRETLQVIRPKNGANYEEKHKYCMAGFELKNTLSDNGVVTRGVCAMDTCENLIKVHETSGIMRGEDGIVRSGAGKVISEDSLVSMNMWGVTPEYMDILQDKFVEFLSNVKEGDLKAEYLLPIIMDDLLQDGIATVKVLSTPDKWFGVTYAEDKDAVVAAFKKLIEAGVYRNRLWE